ncbi:MAG: helix-turn-helix domain-containing protein [Oscillospiraceae bacterium]|nr:helix-turn-helix domain-containing protein [Oscillospiraceae bacterium]
MSIFRLSNSIFVLGLDTQEIAVYAYLCSLPGNGHTITGGTVITVKQRTIAVNCGIKSPVTVAKTIDQLREKGLVDYLERQYKANGHRGAYWYAVTKHPTDSSFFMVNRHVFGMLVPRQMLVYLFLCKSFSTVLHDCWNSYNDIAAQIRMKRESVVQIIGELVAAGLIVRMQRRSRVNRRVFVDNHYSIIRFENGHIRVKMPKMRQTNRNECSVAIFPPAMISIPIRGSP